MAKIKSFNSSWLIFSSPEILYLQKAELVAGKCDIINLHVESKSQSLLCIVLSWRSNSPKKFREAYRAIMVFIEHSEYISLSTEQKSRYNVKYVYIYSQKAIALQSSGT